MIRTQLTVGDQVKRHTSQRACTFPGTLGATPTHRILRCNDRLNVSKVKGGFEVDTNQSK